MCVGFQENTITDWMNFDDEDIDEMDGNALDFWKTWKPIYEE